MRREASKKTKSLICFLLFFAMLSSLVAVNSAHCKSDPQTIYLDPSAYYFDSTTPVGTKFNATVWVSSDAYPWNLMMWQVQMNFNDTLLNCTTFAGSVTGNPESIRAWPNQDLNGSIWDASYVFYNTADTIGNPTYYHNSPGSGSIVIGDIIANNKSISAAKKLCQFEFEIEVTPPEGTIWNSSLSLDASYTYLYDYNGAITGVILESGSYIIPENSTALLLSLMVATVFAAIFIDKLRLIRLKKKI
jgi:hypothetical protein